MDSTRPDRLGLLAVFSALCLCCTVVAQRQIPRTAFVQGSVVPVSASRMPDILQVRVHGSYSGFDRTHLVEGGHFEFRDVPPGLYQLEVQGVGSETREFEFKVDDGQDSVELEISVDFRRPADQRSDGPATVAVDELALPPEVKRLLQKAGKAGRKLEHKRAIQLLEKAVALEPGCYQAWNNLASQYVQMGRWEDALHSSQTSLQLKKTATVYRNLAQIYLYFKDIPQATMALSASYRLTPSLRVARQLGDLYLHGNDPASALGYYQKALLFQRETVVLLLAGECLVRLDQLEAARELGQEAKLAAASPEELHMAEDLIRRARTRPAGKP